MRLTPWREEEKECEERDKGTIYGLTSSYVVDQRREGEGAFVRNERE